MQIYLCMFHPDPLDRGVTDQYSYSTLYFATFIFFLASVMHSASPAFLRAVDDVKCSLRPHRSLSARSRPISAAK